MPESVTVGRWKTVAAYAAAVRWLIVLAYAAAVRWLIVPARAAGVRFEPAALNASGEWASGDGPAAVELGGFHLTGVAPEQMDGAAYTFAALPRMVGVTLGIVCLVLGAAFRSALVPLRAVVCLV